MIDQWFFDDIRERIENTKRLVVTDTRGEGRFLLDMLPTRHIQVIDANNPNQELNARLKAENDFKDKNVIFYTTIPQSKLTQLMEYAKTCGCIVLDDMESYIKNVLFRELGINSRVDGRSLILAAKMSKGKDENWWRAIAQGITNPMNPQSLIIDFLTAPDIYHSETDADVYSLMQEEACRIAGIPKTAQTSSVLATAFMKSLFDALLSNTVSQEQLDIYYTMTDSVERAEQMEAYVLAYTIPQSAKPLQAHPDHPFKEIDARLFRQLSNTLKANGDTTPFEECIVERISSKKALRYKSSWLREVLILLRFKLGSPHAITSMDGFAAYYRDTFAPIDTAMRRLYVEWLKETDVLRPVQEYYERFNHMMLASWFEIVDKYAQSQQGLLEVSFKQASGRTAIIVCDALRLEMAEAIASRSFPQGTTPKRNTAWSKLPSVTPNGMSALYDLASPSEDNIANRHAALKQAFQDVEIMPLQSLNSNVTAQRLVLLYGSIDNNGEKQGLNALADISTYEKLLYDKICELLRMGFQSVSLTTDHGFVITGILDEADKVPVPAGGQADERFVTSHDQLDAPSLIERSDYWPGSNYQYYAKTDKPFKTRGMYGYAHGGLTPQECLIPIYRFDSNVSVQSLSVKIANKQELNAVTGQFYKIVLTGVGDANNLFEAERRVKLLFYNASGQEVSASTIMKIVAGKSIETEDTLNADYLKLVVVDAVTTEQLDTCEIRRSSARDLDDLF